MKDQSPNQPLPPRYSEKCKHFEKKNCLAFYILVLDPETKELKHREMLRIFNHRGGEFYLFPRPLDKSNFHISHTTNLANFTG